MAEGISQIVQQVLNREDIEGLLSLGAPHDEYEGEAEKVAQAIQHMLLNTGELHLSSDRVAGALREVWARAFGPYSEEDLAKREAAFRRAATQIIRALESGPE